MVLRPVLIAATMAACAASCASPPRALAPVTVRDAQGTARDLRAEVGRAELTVVTFFSSHCPTQRAHDARLRALYDAYAARGVQFIAIDAEASASPERDGAEARARMYPFPIWSDPRGDVADALGAESATYTVVLDRTGAVRYTGGLDSDRTELSDDAAPFVRDALDDLLAGRAPRRPKEKTLGCALQR